VVRHSHIHKYPHEAVRITNTKIECHQLYPGTRYCATTSSARGLRFGHSGGHQPDIKEIGRQAQDRLQVCVGSKEGQDSGQVLNLQRQAEPCQGRQDPQEEICQGLTGGQEDGLHQADQSHQQASGQVPGGRRSRQDAEEQDNQTQKEINKQHQRLSPVIWYDLVLHGLTYTGCNIKCRHEHRYKNNDNG
jgi:hypothetical protein